MYVRKDRKGNRPKSPTYLSLAQNVKEPGPDGRKRTKPIIFANLGAEENLDLGVVRSMRDAIDRYLQKRLAAEGQPPESTHAQQVSEAAEELGPRLAPLRLLCSREYGMRALLEPIWKDLGLKDAMVAFGSKHRTEFDFEAMMFGMVLNRLVDPLSKRACNTWLKEEAYFPEAADWKVDYFYGAMDILDQHRDELMDRIERAVAERLAPEELSLRLLDTTSTYFESDLDDVERAAVAHEHDEAERTGATPPRAPYPQVVNEPPIRMRGHSKDHRPDLPQVVVGVVSVPGGQLLRSKTAAGNTNDQTLALELIGEIRDGWPESRVAVVLDSGTGGRPNQVLIDTIEPPVDRISAVPLGSSKRVAEMVDASGGWRPMEDKPGWTIMTFNLPQAVPAPPERVVGTCNPLEVDRVRGRIDSDVRRIEQALSEAAGRSDTPMMQELLAQAGLRRYLRKMEDERYELDRTRIERDRKRAGFRAFRTTLTDLEPEEIVAASGKQADISTLPLGSDEWVAGMLEASDGWRAMKDRPGWTITEVGLPAEPPARRERVIVTRNPLEADRVRRRIDKHVARIEAALSRDTAGRGETPAMRELIRQPGLRQYLRKTEDGRYELDRTRVERDRKRAGVHALRTTVTDLEPEVVVGAYRKLLDVESDFRTFKGPIQLRPMHHRADRRIRAHVLICHLAVVCRREVERRTGQNFDKVAAVFQATKAVRIQQGTTQCWQRMAWSEKALEVLGVLGAEEGPLSWGAERVDPEAELHG